MREKVTEQLVKRHFGENVSTEKMMFGGLRVTTETGGSVEISKSGEIKNIYGGRDVFAACVSLAGEIGGPITATGSNESILALLAHAEVQNIQIIPVAPKEGGIRFVQFIATGYFTLIAAGIGALCGGIVGAIVAGGAAAFLASALTERMIKTDQRKRSQSFHSIFPAIHGSDREATREAARREGRL